MKQITSTKNPQLAAVRALLDKKNRDASGLYVAEGANLVKDAQDADVRGIYVAKSASERHQPLLLGFERAERFLVDDRAFLTIADTVTTNGILAVVAKPPPRQTLGEVVVVLDNVQDAGNVGTIIRTAVAMGFCDFVTISSADAYNPKAVRASMGGIYYANVINCDHESAKVLLKEYKTVILDMYGQSVFDASAQGKIALVVGNESGGVSQFFRKNCDQSWGVPMYSQKIESLNAAVSMSIVLAIVAKNRQG